MTSLLSIVEEFKERFESDMSERQMRAICTWLRSTFTTHHKGLISAVEEMKEEGVEHYDGTQTGTTNYIRGRRSGRNDTANEIINLLKE